MGMPRKLKNFNIFADGKSWIGDIGEVDLPKLSRKFEDWRGGGMNGPVPADLGIEKLETDMTFGGFMSQIFEKFGISQADGVMLRFAGAYQSDSTGAVDAVEVVMRGRYQEIDMGKAKGGESTEFKVKGVLSYYKLSMNGKVLIEIDLLNFIEIVNGVDILAAQRKAIGL